MPTYLFSTSKKEYPNITSINSLDIEFLKPEINFSKYDYFIITSKQISQALLAYDKEKYKEIKALCISFATAKSYEGLDAEVLAIAEGYGESILDVIRRYPLESKWLYLRGEKVASNFALKSRDAGYSVDEAILYKSSCSHEMKGWTFEKESTLIFTSPSSVECYLKTYDFSSDMRVIVIGKSTAKAIPKNIAYEIAENTSIEACINRVKL